MRKKLFAGMLAGVMLVGLTSVMPAQAGQKNALVYFIHGGMFSGDPYGADTKADKGCNPDGPDAIKKRCAPWANLPDWPTPPGVTHIAKGIGGHFHKQYIQNKTGGVAWDQEVSLLNDEDPKADSVVTYTEATCATGVASGTLVVEHSEQTPLGLIKDHGMPRKDVEHYDFDYVRAGVTAAIVATNAKKTAVIVAQLIFHAKEPEATTADRCLGIGTGVPFKVSFDVLGIAIGS